MRRQHMFRMLRFLPLVVLFVALIGYLVMSLWNGLMPSLFGLPKISYWEAWGLLLLSRILFGGLRHGGGGGRWRHRMMERWDQMTPEEREKLRQSFGRRCGHAAPPDAPSQA